MLYDPKWSVPLTPQEALLRAADILERDGWCQRVRIDIEGRRCVASAIDLATAHSPNPVALRNEARELLQRHLPLGFLPLRIEWWNDGPRRTKEQVITKLRVAGEA
jgi:hypothetical protein